MRGCIAAAEAALADPRDAWTASSGFMRAVVDAEQENGARWSP